MRKQVAEIDLDVIVDDQADPVDHGAALARFLLAYVRSQPDTDRDASPAEGPQLFEAQER